jgi:hypothetical protein
MSANRDKAGPETKPNANWLDIVQKHVGSLESGVVEIVVHNSRVVQIEKTEKLDVRENASPAQPKPGKIGLQQGKS